MGTVLFLRLIRKNLQGNNKKYPSKRIERGYVELDLISQFNA